MSRGQIGGYRNFNHYLDGGNSTGHSIVHGNSNFHQYRDKDQHRVLTNNQRNSIANNLDQVNLNSHNDSDEMGYNLRISQQ